MGFYILLNSSVRSGAWFQTANAVAVLGWDEGLLDTAPDGIPSGGDMQEIRGKPSSCLACLDNKIPGHFRKDLGFPSGVLGQNASCTCYSTILTRRAVICSAALEWLLQPSPELIAISWYYSEKGDRKKFSTVHFLSTGG